MQNKPITALWKRCDRLIGDEAMRTRVGIREQMEAVEKDMVVVNLSKGDDLAEPNRRIDLCNQPKIY